LPQKREYGLLSDLECSRNCWKNTQARMLQKSKNYKKHVAVFDFLCNNIKKHLKCERKTIILSHKREYGLSSILNIVETVTTHTSQNNEWVKILQRTCNCFWFELWEQKDILKALVRLLFCHTSESTVYCLILHVLETVEKTRKPECCRGQNITKNMQMALISFALTEKKIKCERKIFILSHKREYDLSSILNMT